GPIFADAFTSSIYPSGWAQKTFQSTADANQLPLRAVIAHVAVGYSPLVWLGAIGALAVPSLSKQTRVALAAVFALQCMLIGWLLPHDARFLGGLHYGLLIAFASLVAP